MGLEGFLTSYRNKQSNGFNNKRSEREFLGEEEHRTSVGKVTPSEGKPWGLDSERSVELVTQRARASGRCCRLGQDGRAEERREAQAGASKAALSGRRARWRYTSEAKRKEESTGGTLICKKTARGELRGRREEDITLRWNGESQAWEEPVFSFLLHSCWLRDWSRRLPNGLISEAGWSHCSWDQVGCCGSSRSRPGGGRPAQRPLLAWEWALGMPHAWMRRLGDRKIRECAEGWRPRAQRHGPRQGTEERSSRVSRGATAAVSHVPTTASYGWWAQLFSASFWSSPGPLCELELSFQFRLGPCVDYASGLWGISFLILIFIINYSLFHLNLFIWLWFEIPLGI